MSNAPYGQLQSYAAKAQDETKKRKRDVALGFLLSVFIVIIVVIPFIYLF